MAARTPTAKEKIQCVLEPWLDKAATKIAEVHSDVAASGGTAKTKGVVVLRVVSDPTKEDWDPEKLTSIQLRSGVTEIQEEKAENVDIGAGLFDGLEEEGE